jgi:N-acylneuraminate cytidylyltransferase
MWVIRGRRMLPLLPFGPADQPWHSSQYPSLPEIHVQNASLEIAWSRVVFEGHNISGNVVMPFLTKDREGFDLNEIFDWVYAEYIADNKLAPLPFI